jgi:uncharacterized protein
MTAAAGAALAAEGIPRRPLGKTGLSVSVFGLGGARIGNLAEQKAAVDVVKRCYDLGVNYFDTAAAGAYGLSQQRYGLALAGVRDKVVLSTKTRHRTWTQAELDLTQSLTSMKTDYLDLYQIHNVINEEDIEFILGRRGVLEMVDKARRDGKVRFVGLTGHTDPAILNKLMGLYKFDTVLMPLGAVDGVEHQKSFEKHTLPVARAKGMGVIAMKTLGAGRVLEQKAATLEECLRYAMSLPIASAIVGADTLERAEANARIAATAKPMSAGERAALRRRMGEFDLAMLQPWKRLPAAPEYTAD